MIRALLIIVLTGCSPVARIAERTNEIRNEAQALRHYGEQVDDQVVVHHADTIDGLAADDL